MGTTVCINEIMGYNNEYDNICHTVQKFIYKDKSLALEKYNALVASGTPCSIWGPNLSKSNIPEEAIEAWRKDRRKNPDRYDSKHWLDKNYWPEHIEIDYTIIR